MYNNPKYQFILDINGDDKIAYPLFKDELKKELEKESGTEFFRTKLDGKLTFILDDYERLLAADKESIFKIEILSRNYTTGAYETDFRITFVYTDLEFDENNESVVLKQSDPDDRYKKVLEGLDNEYNLIDIAPALSPVTYINRPMFQFYIKGSNHILNVLGGVWWETEIEPSDDSDFLIYTCYFSTSLLWEFGEIGTGESQQFFFRMLSNNEELDGHPDWPHNVYEVPDNDLVGREVMGYKYISTNGNTLYPPYLDPDVLGFISDEYVDDTNEFGRVPTSCSAAEKYYKRQYDPYYGGGNDIKCIPFDKSNWGCFAFWINYSDLMGYYEDPPPFNGACNKTINFPYCYLLSDVIKTLLNNIDSTIIHEQSIEYSEFLYGNGNNNVIGGNQFNLLISPKSNFLAQSPDEPAVRSLIKLGDLLDELWKIFKLRWHIDENNKFIIEHIKWYDNGGSYFSPRSIQLDLTQLYNNRARQNWELDQKKHDYDKADMPQRYHFKWMDSVSRAFSGNPIEILSNYVELGRKDEINVNMFTTDLEFISANPNDTSKEGYVLIGAKPNEDNNIVEGNDSDMSGPSNWYPNPYTNATWDTNSTVPGKFYCKWQPVQYDYCKIFLDLEDKMFFLNKYKVRFKMRMRTGGDTVWHLLQWNPSDPANPEKLEFTVTNIEQTFEFDSYLARSQYFDIITEDVTNGETIEIELDDVEIFPLDSFYTAVREEIIDEELFQLQNLDLSWYFLHENIWKYDLPALNIIVNKQATVAESVRKLKNQEINFPYIADLDPIDLIKTSKGDGEIEKISITLLSRMNKITLKHDT